MSVFELNSSTVCRDECLRTKPKYSVGLSVFEVKLSTVCRDEYLRTKRKYSVGMIVFELNVRTLYSAHNSFNQNSHFNKNYSYISKQNLKDVFVSICFSSTKFRRFHAPVTSLVSPRL